MKRHAPPAPVELVVAPAAIERALDVYKHLHPQDPSVILQARKILTQHIFGMVDQGEQDEQRLTVGGLAHLKAVERDHEIKSAQAAPKKKRKKQGVIPPLIVRGHRDACNRGHQERIVHDGAGTYSDSR